MALQSISRAPSSLHNAKLHLAKQFASSNLCLDHRVYPGDAPDEVTELADAKNALVMAPLPIELEVHQDSYGKYLVRNPDCLQMPDLAWIEWMQDSPEAFPRIWALAVDASGQPPIRIVRGQLNRFVGQTTADADARGRDGASNGFGARNDSEEKASSQGSSMDGREDTNDLASMCLEWVCSNDELKGLSCGTLRVVAHYCGMTVLRPEATSSR